ncbi:hypothetical protein M436DRAFT_47218 [Aureobasidium namibiae CBS 147.97]|uniref:DUF1772-domain-containing protein n=1 Tax=Aureobasidium namibiae CBS 147.97 TaxID=1043004 RepID=A0A074XE85_9PEZI|nr:uncharacterized protein M436DRAFT_47218 [Aureobasidium namibiae CBS 147.97]KEQ72931.1 hypothetical protein M436DRAFT_47218 [Aureobasidium namibiae CBS 147.97]
MDTTTTLTVVRILGPATSLATAGAILSISFLYTPLLSSSARSQSSSKPAPSSTLPAIRFIFSRGSHFFPQAAVFAATNFGYLAYHCDGGIVRIVGLELQKRTGLVMAGMLSMAIGPITGVMLPVCNNALREMGALEAKGRGEEVDELRLKELVKRFEVLNYVRGAVMLAGGVLGLAVVAA